MSSTDVGDTPITPAGGRSVRRMAVAARVLAALVGGYALAYGFTAMLTTYLPLVRADRVVYASLGCFAVWTAAALYAFGARSALRAWLVIGGLALSMLAASLFAGDLGARP